MTTSFNFFFLVLTDLEGFFFKTIFLLLPHLFYEAKRFFALTKVLVFFSFSYNLGGFLPGCIYFIDDYLFIRAPAKKKDNYNVVVTRLIII